MFGVSTFIRRDSCVNYGCIVGRSPLDDDYADNDYILMALSRGSELDLVLLFPGKKYFNEFYQEYNIEKFTFIFEITNLKEFKDFKTLQVLK